MSYNLKLHYSVVVPQIVPALDIGSFFRLVPESLSGTLVTSDNKIL